jgi:hypothetical protein
MHVLPLVRASRGKVDTASDKDMLRLSAAIAALIESLSSRILPKKPKDFAPPELGNIAIDQIETKRIEYISVIHHRRKPILMTNTAEIRFESSA